ncbi:YbaB/EbfC family nucleoid-associated protein [Desulfurella sp.]|uniref:YbaB/EbfC family nucleoid-associated protein n=1 Tax=Desulfurella sp. TaxID=1962857 RepID=UPI003D0A0728
MAKGFGGLDMGSLMSQAKKMQKEIERIQQEAAKEVTQVSVGGGMISVSANGDGEIVEIKISKELLSDDVEMLEDLLLSGVNEAIRKAKEKVKEKMSALTGGLNIPGL